jgi:uncharacterized membrane protein (DUF106 family)
MNGAIWSWRIKQKCWQIDFVSHQQIVQLFCNRGSLEGAIKTIIGTKTDLVFLYMKLLLNSMCPMIHSSIIIVYTYIWYFDYYSTVLSGKLAVATGHGMLISSVASLKIYSCYVNFKALSLFISLEIHWHCFYSLWTQKYLHSRSKYSGWLCHWC